MNAALTVPSTSLRRTRQPSFTLLVALALVALFAVALVSYTLRAPGDPNQEPGAAPLGAANQQEMSSTPSPIPSAVPSLTPTPSMGVMMATPTMIMPQPGGIAVPPKADLDGIRLEMQSWNNSGPAALAMALGYWGWEGDQADAASWLKPHVEDKGVTPWQMVAYVDSQTPYDAMYMIGGSTLLLKSLVAEGYPVVVPVGLNIKDEGWIGHYVLVMGYDDFTGDVLTYDSYLGNGDGAGRAVSYTVFDDLWRQFNRAFIVPYRPAHQARLYSVLGNYLNANYAAGMALETARAEAAAQPDDQWAWFNMGTTYVLLGDYANAAQAYDEAFSQGMPYRLLWYQFGPYEAYLRVDRLDDVHSYADAAIDIAPDAEESYYWQAMAYSAQGDADGARDMLAEVVRINPNFFYAETYRYAGLPQFNAAAANALMEVSTLVSTATPVAFPLYPTLSPTEQAATVTAQPTWEMIATQFALTPTAPPDLNVPTITHTAPHTPTPAP